MSIQYCTSDKNFYSTENVSYDLFGFEKNNHEQNRILVLIICLRWISFRLRVFINGKFISICYNINHTQNSQCDK